MENNKNFSSFELFCFISICIVNQIKLYSAQNFISTVGTGCIANLLLLSIVALIFGYILSILFKNFSSSDIIDISEYLGGKTFKFIIGIIFILFLICSICFSIANFSYLLKTIYFPRSPILFVVLFFALSLLYSNLIGVNSFKKTICFIIPFSFFSVFLIFINSCKQYTLYRVSPILGQNIKKTFLDGLINFSNFSFIFYFYFIMPFVKNKKNYFKIFKATLIVFFVAILLVTIALLTRFAPFDNSEEINSMYILTLSIELTNFLQRVDALFILLWTISTFAYISVLLFWIIEISDKLFHFEDKKMLSFPYTNLILGLTIFILNNNLTKLIKHPIFKFISIFISIILGFIILILANLKKKKIRR